ncbi:DUF3775 domain-containing protein [Acuticoccus mangrovi]|uniref:DUF3775 domain-containing protein n=1 Tax=Acuticoccus mangrovi TaxID=2796142 RepID=A0A934IH52_9HYPH|nr:DUF3775 domain-containing protein [Acuticoccus mangrovi]MBJ3776373.1 DUF3775 domain-containing protein [Acuticoccus mangrovi]
MSTREESATELNIDTELVRIIIVKARAALFEMPDAEAGEMEEETELDAGTSLERDDPAQLAEENAEDGTLEEAKAMISSLNVDEQAELVALTAIGRGDYEPSEIEAAVRDAKANAEGPADEALFEIELFPSLLETGLDAYEAWRDRVAD